MTPLIIFQTSFFHTLDIVSSHMPKTTLVDIKTYIFT